MQAADPQAVVAAAPVSYQVPSSTQSMPSQAEAIASSALYQASSPAQPTAPQYAAGASSSDGGTQANGPAGPLWNTIFGVGHVVLIALTFLPWAKGGLQTFNPYIFAKIYLENGLAYLENGLVDASLSHMFIGGVTMLILLVIVAFSAIGAFMRFAKSKSFNIGNIVVFGACVLFLLIPFFLPRIEVMGAGSYQDTMDFEIGFYLEIIAAAILSVLGSGKINIQKLLSKGNANG